jgi:hypothetical protein
MGNMCGGKSYPLLDAVRDIDLRLMKALLAKGEDINQADDVRPALLRSSCYYCPRMRAGHTAVMAATC